MKTGGYNTDGGLWEMDSWTVKDIGKNWYSHKHDQRAEKICKLFMEHRMGLEGLFSGDLTRTEFRTLLMYLHRVRKALESGVWQKASMRERGRIEDLTKTLDSVLSGLMVESFFAADELRELMKGRGLE